MRDRTRTTVVSPLGRGLNEGALWDITTNNCSRTNDGSPFNMHATKKERLCGYPDV